MAVKFSDFTTGATTANTFVVGYDSVAGTNDRYTLAQLTAGILAADSGLTAGSVPFIGGTGEFTQNNDKLFWDKEGEKLGIGTAEPDTELQVVGNIHVDGQGYSELHDDEITNLTFNWNDGNIQTTTMGASSPTFTPTNPKLGATYILTLVQTGTVTATWTGVKWPAATAPTLSGNLKTDVVVLICYNAADAGLYYGSSVLDFTT